MHLNVLFMCLREVSLNMRQGIRQQLENQLKGLQGLYFLFSMLFLLYGSPFLVQETDRPTFCGLLRDHCFGIYDLSLFKFSFLIYIGKLGK